jgi:hypothetical protein
MVYSIKRKEKQIKKTYQVETIQNNINHKLYDIKEDEGKPLIKPKLLTIIIKKEKEHYFHFLRDETEFKVKGVWKDVEHKHKIYKENNAEIQIQFLDNEDNTVSTKLKNLFTKYNKSKVKEKVLYVTAEPLDMTSLNLKRGRK